MKVLARSLRRVTGVPGLTVRPWRAGTDFWADLVEDGTAPSVVRSPRAERVRTSYDGDVDFGVVLEKEAVALRLMAAAGLPVPEILGRHRGTGPGEPSWLRLSLVPHDQHAELPLDRLGGIVRRLHGIRPRAAGLSPHPSWTGFVRQRLWQRLRAARRYCPLPADASLEPVVTALLGTRAAHATSLLHMDLRRENICVEGGRIAALIDLSNCIVGDPLMELGRIRGYGLLTEEFRRGYGADRFDAAASSLLDLYELDTALLLTVVSVEEFDDPVLHRDQAARATELAARIAAAPALLAFDGRALVPAADSGEAPAVADSWLVEAGGVRFLDGHRDRFTAACRRHGVAADRLGRFWAAVLGALPGEGRWFPRVELTTAGQLRYRLRPAPPRRELTPRVAADPRRSPTVKGPDLPVLAGSPETVLCTPDGLVLEGSTTSLLWWEGSTLCVPDPALPLLAGVTTAALQRRARELGIRVEPVRCRVDRLDGREVWLVNALHGIRPVLRWESAGLTAAPARRAPSWQRWWAAQRVTLGARPDMG
ncbi:hypothetical protein L083_5545 [Actinoplanes sp. N902-109]|nr:hypothetical protein L083_5545 [Actinoplanes sp. N902-109]